MTATTKTDEFLTNCPACESRDTQTAPIVRTVGDLTPRHLGRWVRIGSSDPGLLVELGADIEDMYVAVDTYPAHFLPLDTPCEVLP